VGFPALPRRRRVFRLRPPGISATAIAIEKSIHEVFMERQNKAKPAVFAAHNNRRNIIVGKQQVSEKRTGIYAHVLIRRRYS
jgi:hypothetical protein